MIDESRGYCFDDDENESDDLEKEDEEKSLFDALIDEVTNTESKNIGKYGANALHIEGGSAEPPIEISFRFLDNKSVVFEFDEYIQMFERLTKDAIYKKQVITIEKIFSLVCGELIAEAQEDE